MIEYQYQEATTFEEALKNLYKIITMLRSPEGCPWDREQTNQTVALDLLEEIYEYLDALSAESKEAASEEVGDLLLNTFMLLRIHEEQADFKPLQAVNQVCAKLIRRHPHVFGDKEANSPQEVLKLWNKVKEDVEGKKVSAENLFSRIPQTMDKLEYALKMQKKMQGFGFDWPDVKGVLDKIDEERLELVQAISKGDKAEIEEELGDLLFATVNLARYLNLSPSLALHRSNHKVQNRFKALAAICEARGVDLNSANVAVLNEIWEEIKESRDYE
ncbi:MAG: nucleoside triphosphate pyrophosphohydrolase [Sphaerochaetaceae bacterium]